LCRQLHVLPRAGGVLDQDWWEMTAVKVVLEALQEKEQEELKKAKARK
jgi:hypothetical protein